MIMGQNMSTNISQDHIPLILLYDRADGRFGNIRHLLIPVFKENLLYEPFCDVIKLLTVGVRSISSVVG